MSKPPLNPGLGLLCRLSEENLDEIVSYLEPRDLGRVRQVCRLLNLYAAQDSLWAPLVIKQFPNKLAEYKWGWCYTFCSLASKTAIPPVPTVPAEGTVSSHLYRIWYRSAVDLTAYVPPVERVPRINVELMCCEQFYDEFMQIGRPAILTNAMRGWLANELWGFEQMAETTGEAVFKASNSGSRHVETKVKLSDYFMYMRSQKEEDPLYVFDPHYPRNAPQLLKHYSVATLKYFQEDMFEVLGDKRPKYRWIVIGPAKTGAPWHLDPNHTSAWNALLRGRKRWAMYPPTMTPPGVQVLKNEYGTVINWSSMSPVSVVG